MLELPQQWRQLLVSALDDYCETLDDTSDLDAVSEAIIEQVEGVSAEVTGVDAEDVIPQLEAQLQEYDSLAEALTEYFQDHPSFRWSGEEIVVVVERLCEVEYLDADEDHDDAGLFDDEAGFEEEEFEDEF